MINFCSLFSGSSGNSLFVSDGATSVLVDAGISGKRIIDSIKDIGHKPEDIDAIVITHEHSDHIKGAGILSRKLNVPIYANLKTWQAMESELGEVDECNKRYFTTGERFCIGDMCVLPFNIPHDAVEPVGYSFFSGERKVTVATDIGHVNKELYENLVGSDFILLESNHDIEMLRMGPYPWYLKQRILGEKGHMSNELAGKLVAKLVEKGTKRVLLGHLSRENNFPQLAFETVKNVLVEKGIIPGRDVVLDVAMRDCVSDLICV